MLELLELCGFDEVERRAQLPRVQAALDRVGLTDDDIQTAKDRLHLYFDTELSGVRMIMGGLLKDMTDIMLLRDEGARKIIHSCMAPGFEVLGMAINTNSEDVRLTYPNFTFMAVLGGMFGKLLPVIEAAERLWLRRGVTRHCGMVKTRVGLISLDLHPRPDLTVTTGYLCDTSPKSNEIMEQVFGIPAYCVDHVQDRQAAEYPDGIRATVLAAKGMRRFSEIVHRETGFQVTDDMVWSALRARKPLSQAMDKVFEVIRFSDPPPLGAVHLNIIAAFQRVVYKESEIPRAVAVLETLLGELQERARQGVGVIPKGSPRVLVLCPMHHSDPRFEYLANRLGLNLVASDFNFTSGQERSGASISDPNDPYNVICQHPHATPGQSLGGRAAIIVDACRRLDIDGVIDHYHVGCRYLAGDTLALQEIITRELGIPVLAFEWDNFDPRTYNEQELVGKLETFRAMVEAAGDSAQSRRHHYE
jgi:benzoyl-CoA reductase/2-hydroxyglutaryl-CoA dehydratase subunit BcrC/BadD/HgdB